MPLKIIKPKPRKKPLVLAAKERTAVFEKTKQLLASNPGLSFHKAALQLRISKFNLRSILLEQGFYSFDSLRKELFAVMPDPKAKAGEKNPAIALLRTIQLPRKLMHFGILSVYNEALRNPNIRPNVQRHLLNVLRLQAAKAPSQQIESEMRYLRQILENTAERMKHGMGIVFRK